MAKSKAQTTETMAVHPSTAQANDSVSNASVVSVKSAAKKKTATQKMTTKKAASKTAKKTTKKKASKSKAKPLYTTDAVRAYLHEIGRVPLLTHEDEIVLGKQVQKMMGLLALKDELAAELPEDGSEEISQAAWAKAANMTEAELSNHLRRGQRSKRKMIEANLRLVVAVAKKYQKRNLEFLDLIQEGTLGLERGVEKFDPMKGYKFSTYAYWWIRQAITRAIAQQARTIRLPIHITEKLNKIKKSQRQFAQQNGRIPTVAEIAEDTGLTVKQVREYLDKSRQPLSLDLRVGDNKDTQLSDLLEDDGQTPDDFATQSSLKSDLRRIMADLTPQQQRVISLRFGLEDGKNMTLAKIGAQLEISRERVRQIEREALTKLRKRQGDMREYLAG